MAPKPATGFAVALLVTSLAGVALSDGSSLFGGYFADSSCSTPYALAAQSHSLQTLAAAIKAAGLVDVLDATSSAITVFAPTDDAFAALADALHLTPEELLSKSDLLSVILEYHVYAEDAYEVSDFKDHTLLVTKEGESLKLKTVGDIVTVEPAAGSTATILVPDLSACKAYVHIIDTVLIPEAAAKALNMDSIEMEGAGQKDSQAVQGIVTKKNTAAATPVPTEIVTAPATPAATVPAVAVSGAREVSPTPVPTVLVAETPATTKMPKLLGGLLAKKTLNTFPTPEATPAETPAPDTPTLKELLLKETPAATEAVTDEPKKSLKDLLAKNTPAATPVQTVLVPEVTTVPAVAVSGARHVPPPAVPSPVAVAEVPIMVASPPADEKPIDELLKKKELNTFTPAATEEATPEPSLPTLKELLLKETPTASEEVSAPPMKAVKGLFSKPTPAPTEPAVTVPAVTVPAVPVSGARVVTSPPVVEVPVSTDASQSPAAKAVQAMPIRAAVAPAVEQVSAAVGTAMERRQEAVAPAVARVGAVVDTAVERRQEAVAPARAAVAQAAADVANNRRGILTPAVEALDGPAVDTAMAPEMMGMAPMMAAMTAPMAAMAPAVQALQGPDMMMMSSMAPQMAPMMAPQTAPEAAMAPAVAALAGPNNMEAPAIAPGMAPGPAPSMPM